MRRLPVFFLLDVSESMIGENHRRMETGIETITSSLLQDPHALETAHLSVIAFAGVARTIVPLTEVTDFIPPRLPIGGGTVLGRALEHLMAEIDDKVVWQSAGHKGDWRPIVYLFTDGKPTDQYQAARERWRHQYARRADLIAVAIGRYADCTALRALTGDDNHVFVYNDQVPGGFDELVRWVTASVTAQSRSVGDPGAGIALASPDPAVMRPLSETGTSLAPSDPDCIVAIGRCQQTKRPYLLKFDRQSVELGCAMCGVPLATGDPVVRCPSCSTVIHHECWKFGNGRCPRHGCNVHIDNPAPYQFGAAIYEIDDCYPIGEDYFEWSGPGEERPVVSTTRLAGSAPCPHCGNEFTVARCGCGKLLCTAGPSDTECPWCNARIRFDAGGGDQHFEFVGGRG